VSKKKKEKVTMPMLEGSYQPTSRLRIKHHRRSNIGAIQFHWYPYIRHHYFCTHKLRQFVWVFLIKTIFLLGIVFYT